MVNEVLEGVNTSKMSLDELRTFVKEVLWPEMEKQWEESEFEVCKDNEGNIIYAPYSEHYFGLSSDKAVKMSISPEVLKYKNLQNVVIIDDHELCEKETMDWYDDSDYENGTDAFVKTEEMSLDEIKTYFSNIKDKMEDKYGDSWRFFVTDDMCIFAREICSECGGIKGAGSDMECAHEISKEILENYNTVGELAEALGIELSIATNSLDCECNDFFCENCEDKYSFEEMYKEIDVDGEILRFCSEECYKEWKESNDYLNKDDETDEE